MRWLLLGALLFSLTGCGDDDYNGGGGRSGGGNYGTYWGVLEVFSTEGYVPEMTQKPEAPAPGSDQKGCPSIAVLLLVLQLLALLLLPPSASTLKEGKASLRQLSLSTFL